MATEVLHLSQSPTLLIHALFCKASSQMVRRTWLARQWQHHLFPCPPLCPPSLKPDGEKDPASLHGSCPTTGGVKWSATKWIHTGKFKA